MTSRGTRGGVDWTSTELCRRVSVFGGAAPHCRGGARAVAALLSAAPALRANQTATFAIR
jgi:hypothetical protein